MTDPLRRKPRVFRAAQEPIAMLVRQADDVCGSAQQHDLQGRMGRIAVDEPRHQDSKGKGSV